MDDKKPELRFLWLFFAWWFSLVYSFIFFLVAFSFSFFDFSLLGLLFLPLSLPFLAVGYAFLLLFLTVGRYVERKLLQVDLYDRLSSRGEKVLFYYVIPNCLFAPWFLFGVFDFGIWGWLVLAIVVTLVRNLSDYLSGRILQYVEQRKILVAH